MNEIQKKALESLSSGYEGDGRRSDYIGQGDHFMDFNGGKNFIDVLRQKRQFKFKIVHTASSGSPATKVVALHTGYYNTAYPNITQAGDKTITIGSPGIKYTDITNINTAGHAVDAVNTDGNILTYDTNGTLVSTCLSGLSIQDFLNFCKLSPAHVPHITLEADDKAAYNEVLYIREIQPFRKYKETPLYLSDYFDTTQFQTGKIEIPTPELQLDGQTVLALAIAPGRTVTVTYWLGAVLNPSAALQNKKSAAYNNIESAAKPGSGHQGIAFGKRR